MRDKTCLAADVIVADDRTTHPVLLVRTPYARAEAASLVDALGLARLGWAVVIQNVRGRLDSEGSFLPFLQEPNDGADTVRWCCEQPWSNGRVAMSGTSYAGFTQWSCALARPAGLKAISPQITASDVRDGWFYEGGALRHSFVQSWGLSLAYTDSANTKESEQETRRWAADLEALYNTPPSRSPLDTLLKSYSRWIDPTDESYWSEIHDLQNCRPPEIPAYHLTGWYDIFCEASLRDFVTMQNNNVGNTQRLVVGPWTHSAFLVQQTGALDHGLIANGFVHDVMGEMHSWLRRTLNDEPVEGGARVFVMGSRVWREMPTWPPAAESHRLHLSVPGLHGSQSEPSLTMRPQEIAGQDHFDYEPTNPVRTNGGRTLDPMLPGAGSFDQSLPGDRDVLFYTSEVLAQDLTVMGMIRAEITFATTGEAADVALTLLDVYPDGRAFNLVGSTQRAKFVPHRPQIVEVFLGSIAVTFKRGHRIGLQVASSNFPHLDLNPSTGQCSTKAVTFVAARQTIYRGGQSRSFIELPVVSLDL